jgi:hypothetical protein
MRCLETSTIYQDELIRIVVKIGPNVPETLLHLEMRRISQD